MSWLVIALSGAMGTMRRLELPTPSAFTMVCVFVDSSTSHTVTTFGDSRYFRSGIIFSAFQMGAFRKIGHPGIGESSLHCHLPVVHLIAPAPALRLAQYMSSSFPADGVTGIWHQAGYVQQRTNANQKLTIMTLQLH